MTLPLLPSLRDLLRILNIKACKQLSQNFLLQSRPIKNFVKAIGPITNNSYILEVGPGPGCITTEIIRNKPKKVVAVELDRRFLILLDQLKKLAEPLGTNVDIYNQDILKFNTEAVFPDIIGSNNIHPDFIWQEISNDNTTILSNEIKSDEHQSYITVNIVGNLPFNISTVLLSQWFNNISERRGIWAHFKVPLTLTFQKEVGERLIAEQGNPERCRFSIISNSLCEVKIKYIIPGTAFLPKAKVDCAVVSLVPRRKPLIQVPYPYLDKFLSVIFQFKQKTIYHGIEALFPPNEIELILRMFVSTGITPVEYVINLSDEQFKSLIEEYHKICLEQPNILHYHYRNTKNELDFNDRKKIQRAAMDGETFNSQFIMSKMAIS